MLASGPWGPRLWHSGTQGAVLGPGDRPRCPRGSWLSGTTSFGSRRSSRPGWPGLKAPGSLHLSSQHIFSLAASRRKGHPASYAVSEWLETTSGPRVLQPWTDTSTAVARAREWVSGASAPHIRHSAMVTRGEMAPGAPPRCLVPQTRPSTLHTLKFAGGVRPAGPSRALCDVRLIHCHRSGMLPQREGQRQLMARQDSASPAPCAAAPLTLQSTAAPSLAEP